MLILLKQKLSTPANPQRNTVKHQKMPQNQLPNLKKTKGFSGFSPLAARTPLLLPDVAAPSVAAALGEGQS